MLSVGCTIVIAVITVMPAQEEKGYTSGLESREKHEPRNIFHCHVERSDQRFAVAESAER
jgi:hypothetical protein